MAGEQEGFLEFDEEEEPLFADDLDEFDDDPPPLPPPLQTPGSTSQTPTAAAGLRVGVGSPDRQGEGGVPIQRTSIVASS